MEGNFFLGLLDVFPCIVGGGGKYEVTHALGWIASTYQRDTEPRDYQECSQVDEPRVRRMPIPRSSLLKSEFIRDFQSELITQLSSVLRSLKPSSRLLMPFFFRPSSNIPFYSSLQGVELRLPCTPLDNGTPG
ncbi:hypothetical protein AVEN_47789-1 [Araneus ventricosus]|uniref:Uncharacterized protein n=1 Tax=Araneus ventricosus TaxID=182803 RepID=A0A4Y2JJ86_ARAVE|nr:hypothetical protein AVEN_47789-1 [Araneus ventricosus]